MPSSSSSQPARRARPRRTLALRAAAVALAGAAFLLARPATLPAWGSYGHRLLGRTAAGALPADMPAFFRNAGPRLAYLNPEPDLWRDGADNAQDSALTGATAPEHFIDFELLPAARVDGILHAPSRFAYAESLGTLHEHLSTVGVLPFRIVEMTQLLRSDFRRWRAAPDSATRDWLEQRIIDDAGILGHYVGDGSQPLHATMRFNGWTGDNPKGYTTDHTLHSRFETQFVQARIADSMVTSRIPGAPRVVTDLRGTIIDYIRASNAQVEPLYQLEQRERFSATTTSPEHQRFVAERLAAGATMLRDLWWTAWVTSADAVKKER